MNAFFTSSRSSSTNTHYWYPSNARHCTLVFGLLHPIFVCYIAHFNPPFSWSTNTPLDSFKFSVQHLSTHSIVQSATHWPDHLHFYATSIISEWPKKYPLARQVSDFLADDINQSFTLYPKYYCTFISLFVRTAVPSMYFNNHIQELLSPLLHKMFWSSRAIWESCKVVFSTYRVLWALSSAPN